MKRTKRIKWENIFILIYIILTIIKYIYIGKYNILQFTIDIFSDCLLGIILYIFIQSIRKGGE